MEIIEKGTYLEYLDGIKDEIIQILREKFPGTYHLIIQEVFNK